MITSITALIFIVTEFMKHRGESLHAGEGYFVFCRDRDEQMGGTKQVEE